MNRAKTCDSICNCESSKRTSIVITLIMSIVTFYLKINDNSQITLRINKMKENNNHKINYIWLILQLFISRLSIVLYFQVMFIVSSCFFSNFSNFILLLKVFIGSLAICNSLKVYLSMQHVMLSQAVNIHWIDVNDKIVCIGAKRKTSKSFCETNPRATNRAVEKKYSFLVFCLIFPFSSLLFHLCNIRTMNKFI